VQKLLQISRKTGENILDFCQKNLKPNGFFIDVHSMWPTSQLVHPSDFEHENRLQKYVHALLHPENQKEVRAINFLVHDQNGEPIADKKRSDMIAKHMIKNGFPVVFDAPYKLLPGYNSSKYYLHFSGLSIDIPRTFLGNPISESDIPKWAEDHEKIHKLSDCLSEGILLATEE